MTHRLAKKRALQKAGLVHVAGWVDAKDAPAVLVVIEAARPQMASALEGTAHEAAEVPKGAGK